MKQTRTNNHKYQTLSASFGKILQCLLAIVVLTASVFPVSAVKSAGSAQLCLHDLSFADDDENDTKKPYVKSDTTIDFSVAQGCTYAFRFEIVGSRGLQPNIAVGNGAVLRTENCHKAVENDHDVYYFQVRATGDPTESTGIYTTLPEQQAVKHCAISIAPLLPTEVHLDTTNYTFSRIGQKYTLLASITGDMKAPVSATVADSSITWTSIRKEKTDQYLITVTAVKNGETDILVHAGTASAAMHITAKFSLPAASAESVRLSVPYVSQKGLLPTGCEIISGMMLTRYWGLSVDVNTFLNATKQGMLHETNSGNTYGPSPDEAFVGSPHSSDGFGCFPPVICCAFQKLLPNSLQAKVVTGTSLYTLAHVWLPAGKPVMVWATINMQAPYSGYSWTVSSTGKTFTWPAEEHCLVLTGYDKTGYWFNDPWNGNGTVHWDKATAELRYRQMGQRSLVVTSK